MIRARFSLYDFYSLSAAQCSQYLSYICTDILINHLPPILRCKYYVILAFPFCMGWLSCNPRCQFVIRDACFEIEK